MFQNIILFYLANIRPIFELLYFLSSLAILYVAILGLQQLTISKENARISIKRETLRITAEQNKYFAELIIPEFNALKKIIDEEKLLFFIDSKVEIVDGKINVKYAINDQTEKEIDLVWSKITKLLNLVECYTTYLTSGVADEQVAYQINGESYCHIVEVIYPLITIIKTKNESFPDITKLFLIWQSRISMQELHNSKLALEEEIKKRVDKPIKPVGL